MRPHRSPSRAATLGASLRPASPPITALLALALVVSAMAPAAAVAQVSSADQICAADADPCLIDSKIETAPSAVLDFGLRQVRLVNGGELNSGEGNLTLRCGSFIATASGQGITMRGQSGGESSGGVVRIEARKSCSRDTSRACINDRDCHFFRDESGNSLPLVPPAGSCSEGDANVLIGTRVFGNSDDPGTLIVRSAGDATVSARISLNNTAVDDAGGVEIEARGDISIAGPIQLEAGFEGQGGEVCLFAGGDISVTEMIEVVGGDFDGGCIEITAGGDVRISQDLNLNSAAGAGAGGELAVDATGDIIVTGGGQSNRVLFSSNGHEDSEAFGGSGGALEFFAGGDIRIGRFVRLLSTGSPPDEFGETVCLDAGGDIRVEGEIESRGRGFDGGGGDIELLAQGSVDVTDTSVLDVSGGVAGTITVQADGTAVVNGSLDAQSAPNTFRGTISVESSGDLTVGGELLVAGAPSVSPSSVILVEGCATEITSGASIENTVVSSVTEIVAHESLVMASGSEVRGVAGGEVVIKYRRPDLPPVLNGTIIPAPASQAVPDLTPCALCGDGLVSEFESCDDGNGNGGDGCSATCQDEGCVAGTPGYPDVALCDDGNACTVDACDDAGNRCTHVLDCDDGLSCTNDSCGAGNECVHTAVDASCDDQIGCTADLCCTVADCGLGTGDELTGCQSYSVPAACDDGVSCTIERCCTADLCGAARDCVSTPRDDVCDDGEVCTLDTCDADTGCETGVNSLPCDDGISCTGSDTCAGGFCTGVDLCAAGTMCNLVTAACDPIQGGPVCGDGQVDEGEECDDGVMAWSKGEFCNAQCLMLGCADADDNGQVSATDALFVLRSAVGLDSCDACVCDVDDSGGASPVTATDALRVLQGAVGVPVQLSCRVCG